MPLIVVPDALGMARLDGVMVRLHLVAAEFERVDAIDEAQVAQVTGELRSATPFIGALVADPSLRGSLGAPRSL